MLWEDIPSRGNRTSKYKYCAWSLTSSINIIEIILPLPNHAILGNLRNPPMPLCFLSFNSENMCSIYLIFCEETMTECIISNLKTIKLNINK